MQQYQQAFIELALAQEVLRFGEFALKSGRTSPYFFNAGLFRSGASLGAVGEAYAQAINAAGLSFDMLLGPAYKGIPLATATAIGFNKLYERDLPFAYNRKEAKQHGEGGQLVGAPLAGRVLIIDDVITAGTAIREVMAMVAETDASVAGVVVGLDRQERGQGDYSAIEELQQEFSIPVLSIINLTDLLSYLQDGEGMADTADLKDTVARIQHYRQQYGTVTLTGNS